MGVGENSSCLLPSPCCGCGKVAEGHLYRPLNPSATLGDSSSHLHVTAGETEAPNGQVPSSRPLSKQMAELRCDPGAHSIAGFST